MLLNTVWVELQKGGSFFHPYRDEEEAREGLCVESVGGRRESRGDGERTGRENGFPSEETLKA